MIRRPAAALVAALAVACGGGGGGTKPVDDAAVTERIVGYFQKALTNPGLSFKVTQLQDTDSVVPGWRRGNLEVSLGEQKQNVEFYVSRDGRYLFRGEAIDLTSDPFQQLMKRIDLHGEPARGPADAKVTIVEYSDFECPFCLRVYTTLEEQVLKEYGDRVRFVFKNLPLGQMHPWAEAAAIASECAFLQGNDQFWAMYNGLFTKQREINNLSLPKKLEEIAAAGGIDHAKLKACVDAKETLPAVKADQAEAASLGVTSTPTFIINGRQLSGAQTFENFKQVIDAELAAAS